MKLRCIIVDDEPLARGFIERYCIKHGQFDIKGLFASAGEALAFLQNNEIDVLFLDVEMPGSSGFELLDQLIYLPKVVLTTSKTEYAFDAFQYNVTDYLKKPVHYNRFAEAVNKIIASFQTSTADLEKDSIYIKADGKLINLKYDEILFIESMGDYVKYVTATKKFMTHSTLKAVEEKMKRNNFLKVHRSYIVNINKIKDIQDNSLLIEGNVIPVSKSHKPDLFKSLNIA
jgi:DNA-binding LytR/AlgR family response regulator